ncbi:hypothetical protein KIH74_27925 [Kineosporia sp. J2-2]|uniref:Uncharacterized protein n=1 Tax=Kineosporia corallincola TaxID=2835133 RepID=A0ABS5TNX4_9ACTN|nr:hypothetical protein [Kineosporia corallincola]MBT0772803.1 hypothetical protein [Kineosporia corallincola]
MTNHSPLHAGGHEADAGGPSSPEQEIHEDLTPEAGLARPVVYPIGKWVITRTHLFQLLLLAVAVAGIALVGADAIPLSGIVIAMSTGAYGLARAVLNRTQGGPPGGDPR